MDKALRDDIATEFHGEYYRAEKKKRGPFWQWLDGANDKMDTFFGKAGLSAPGVTLLGSVVLTAIAPPLGIAALAGWVANYGLEIYSGLTAHAGARKAVEKDIDSGVLPERFNDVLDGRVKGLHEKIDLYTAQKSQLPPKGSVTKSFAAAVSGETNDNAAPAPVPAPKPEAAPKP